MKLTIEQMQGIIDNAPDGAARYCVIDGMTFYGGLSSSLLSDLRKELEQAKAKAKVTHEAIEASKKQAEIVNAVSDSGAYAFPEAVKKIISSRGDYICDVESYNQCVKELAEAAWMNPGAPGEPQYYEMYKLAWRDSLIANEYVAHKINDAIVKEVQLCDEWQNGDECEWLNGSGGGVFVGLLPHNNEIAVISQGEFTFNMLLSGLSRPETLEQKAAKERNDKAIELCKLRCESFGHRYNWDALGEKKKEGYRKMIDAGVQLPE
jgi:hypothetical protein